jgi:chromosome segregation ATPase
MINTSTTTSTRTNHHEGWKRHGQANHEKDELHGNIRAANERLEDANEQMIAHDDEIDQLRREIGSFRQLFGGFEAAVAEDGKHALEDARKEGAKALDAESKKIAAAKKALNVELKKVAAAKKPHSQS